MENIKGFISVFMTAISSFTLYSKEHISIDELVKKALMILNQIFNTADKLEIMIVDEDLIINKIPIRGAGIQGNKLVRRLKEKGISNINFLKGITFSELKKLVADISSSEKGINSYPHIESGIVDVRFGESETNLDLNIKDLQSFTFEQVEKVKREYKNISFLKELHIEGFDRIVANFAMMLKKEVNLLKLLNPIKLYNDRIYHHATNVAILSMFQAQTLGIKDELIHDIGIAALLHDVGKLIIPADIQKKYNLHNKKDWEETELHTVYGAKYLARIDRLTRLAPVVAYEHHFRYDGRGYSKTDKERVKQHICSQIVAIADNFDIMTNSVSHGEPLEIEEVLSLMRATEEGVFNPFLIDNFLRSMYIALSTC